MKHLLSIADLGRRRHPPACSTSPTTWSRSAAGPIPKVPALRGKTVVQPVLRGLDPHPAELRDRGQAAVGRHDDLHRRPSQRQQGREPARHDRDDQRDGRRRLRRPPPLDRRAVADHAAGRRPAIDQRRRRLARAPHPGAARLLHDPHRRSAGRTGSTGCTSPSSATSSTAGWPAATCWRSPRSAPTSRSSPRRRCCRRRSTAGRSTSSHDLDARARRARRALPAAHAARADGRGAACRPCASTRRLLRPHAAAGRAAAGTHALVMHPGPMNRGVEIAADPAELPGVGDHPPGRPTAWPCAWRCCSACSARATGDVSGERGVDEPRCVITRRHACVDQTGERRGRRARSPTADRRRSSVGRGVGRRRRRPCSTPRGCVVAPGLRRPPHPPARARPGGGRDDRDRQPRRRARRLHRGRRHAQHRPGAGLAWPSSSSSARQGERAGLCDVLPAGCITVGPGRRARWPRWPSWPPPACASSPTTATACRTRC